MASALLTDETNDLVTCPVCFSEYDDVDESRKPKFLPCSHTLCLQCLKSLKGTCSLTCPLCRKICLHSGDVSTLPNNQYALCMLKMNKASQQESPTTITKPPVPKKLSWCLTCEAMADGLDCFVQEHSLADMSSESLTNFEALLSLKQFYAQMRDDVRSKLAELILEKKDVQSYLENVSLALKTAAADVDRMKEENGTMVAELSSMMDSGLLAESRSKEEENRAFLAEFLPLLESCRSVDSSLNTAKDKIKETFQGTVQKMDSCKNHPAGQMAEQQAKTRITVKLADATSGTPMTGVRKDLLTTGFNVKLQDKKAKPTSNLKDLLLISHVIISYMNRNGGMTMLDSKPSPAKPTVKPKKAPSVSKPPSQLSKPSPLSTLLPLQPKSLPASSFTLGYSSFVITVQKQPGNITQGQIRFRPSEFSGCDLNFVRQMGQFCFRSPKKFSSSIAKAVPDQFLVLPLTFAGSGFNLEPNDTSASTITQQLANCPLHVGMMKWKSSTGGSCWALLFVLERFLDPKYQKHIASLSPASYLGIVEAPSAEVVTQVSRIGGKERSSYTFTLESQ